MNDEKKELQSKLYSLGFREVLDDTSIPIVRKLLGSLQSSLNMLERLKSGHQQSFEKFRYILYCFDQLAEGNIIKEPLNNNHFSLFTSSNLADNNIKQKLANMYQDPATVSNAYDDTFNKLCNRIHLLETKIDQTQAHLSSSVIENANLTQKIASTEKHNLYLAEQLDKIANENQNLKSTMNAEKHQEIEDLKKIYEAKITLICENAERKELELEQRKNDIASHYDRLKTVSESEINDLKNELGKSHRQQLGLNEMCSSLMSQKEELHQKYCDCIMGYKNAKTEASDLKTKLKEIEIRIVLQELSHEKLQSADSIIKELKEKLVEEKSLNMRLESKNAELSGMINEEESRNFSTIQSLQQRFAIIDNENGKLKNNNRNLSSLLVTLKQIFYSKCSPLLGLEYTNKNKNLSLRDNLISEDWMLTNREFLSDFERYILDREKKLATAVLHIEEMQGLINSLSQGNEETRQQLEYLTEKCAKEAQEMHPLYNIPLDLRSSSRDKNDNKEWKKKEDSYINDLKMLSIDVKDYRDLILSILAGNENLSKRNEFLSKEKELMRYRLQDERKGGVKKIDRESLDRYNRTNEFLDSIKQYLPISKTRNRVLWISKA